MAHVHSVKPGSLASGHEVKRFALAFLLIGASTQLIQLIYLREFLTVFYGTELAIAIIFGTWLFWTALGSALTSVFVKRTGLPEKFFSAGLIAVTLMAPAGVWLIRDLRSWFEVASGDYIQLSNLIIAAFIIFAPLCLSIGSLFTLAAAISGSPREVYIFESLGCAAGGLISIFVIGVANPFSLIVFAAFMLLGVIFIRLRQNTPWLSALRSRATSAEEAATGMNGGANLAEALQSEGGLASAEFRKDAPRLAAGSFILRKRLSAIAGLLAIALLAAFLAGSLEDLSLKRFWQNFNAKFILRENHNSKYGLISVVDYEQQHNIYQSGHLLFSAPDKGELAAITHILMAQPARPEKVLLVGGGAAGMLKEIIKYPVTKVDYLEIDPLVLDIARKYISKDDLNALTDRRVNIHHQDGRLFIQQTDRKYDVIIINAPDPLTAFLNRYFTLEFFRAIKKRLNPGGVFALGAVTSHYHYPDPDIIRRNRSIYHTLNNVFNYILVTPGASSFFLAADNNCLALDERTIVARLASHGFHEVNIYSLTEDFYVEKVNFELRTGADYNPLAELPRVIKPAVLNQDNKPITYYFSVLVWSNLANDPFASFVKLLARLKFWHLLLPVFLLFLIFLVTRRKYFTVAFCVFFAGLYGMTLEVLILFSFQSIFGYVYHYAGLLISLFMIGLALGAWLQSASRKPARNMLRINGLFLILLALYYLAVNISMFPLLSFIIFLSLMLINGLLTGSLYPIAISLMPAGNNARKGAACAGCLYALDIAGGLAGALLVSCFLFPLMGLSSVIGFLGVLGLCALAFVLLKIV